MRQSLRIGHARKPCNKKDAPAEKHGTWRQLSGCSKKEDKATFYSFTEARVILAPSSKKPEEREFVVDFGAPMHMLSTKDLSSGELETLRKSRNPTTVLTANGEVQRNEEALVHVHDLDLFVTLDNTPAFLSLGKLCEEHGYSSEWASGQRPHLTKNGTRILCKTENIVLVPGLSSSSSASSSST